MGLVKRRVRIRFELREKCAAEDLRSPPIDESRIPQELPALIPSLQTFYKPFTPSLCAAEYGKSVDNLFAEVARRVPQDGTEKSNAGDPTFRAQGV